MKIDYDLIREIMLYIEKNPSGRKKLTYSFIRKNMDIDKNMLDLHMKYLSNAGLIDKLGPIVVTGLSNAGHDFLKHTRENSIWNKVKSTMQGKAIDSLPTVAYEIFSQLMYPC